MSRKSTADVQEMQSASGMLRFNALKPGTNLLYSILFIILALMCVIPVIFVIIISFSSEQSISQIGYSFTPRAWAVTAYEYVATMRNSAGFPIIVRAFLNSVGITIVGTAIGLTLISTMGYVLSRRNFRLRGVYIWMIFIPMIFSGGMLSTYVVNTQVLMMRNTYWALIFPICWRWNCAVCDVPVQQQS